MLSLNFICFCDKKHVFSPHDEKCKNNIYRVIIDIDNPIYIVHSEQKNDRAQFQHLISILASNKKCRCETNEQYVVFFFQKVDLLKMYGFVTFISSITSYRFKNQNKTKLTRN